MMEVLADRYELCRPIGEGSMARVLEAHDRLLERAVAVKVLRDDIAADPMARVRFLQEARTAAKLTHPNAVAVYDSGGDGDGAWIVMELIDGENLSQRLAWQGPLEEDEALRIADCVLAALEAAHDEEIVHRDVKPENVMLPGDGSIKLADFGIAKSLQESSASLTATGQITGTPQYLSPEQVNGEPASPASDVYAVGILLYEMLVGSPPFTGDDPIAVAVAHERRPVPDVRAGDPDVSPETAAVVTRALAKDPADRYPDAEAMRSVLPSHTRDRTVVAAIGATEVVHGDGDVMRGSTSPLRTVKRWAVVAATLLGAAGVLAVIATGSPDDAVEPSPAADTDAAAEEDDAGDDDTQATTRDSDGNGEGEGGDSGKAKGKHEDKNPGKGKGKARGKKD